MLDFIFSSFFFFFLGYITRGIVHRTYHHNNPIVMKAESKDGNILVFREKDISKLSREDGYQLIDNIVEKKLYN